MHTSLAEYKFDVCFSWLFVWPLSSHHWQITRASVEFYYYRLIKIKTKRKTESTADSRCMPLSSLYVCLIHEPVEQVTSHMISELCGSVCAAPPPPPPAITSHWTKVASADPPYKYPTIRKESHWFIFTLNHVKGDSSCERCAHILRIIVFHISSFFLRCSSLLSFLRLSVVPFPFGRLSPCVCVKNMRSWASVVCDCDYNVMVK